jgi:hypothetical protein
MPPDACGCDEGKGRVVQLRTVTHVQIHVQIDVGQVC